MEVKQVPLDKIREPKKEVRQRVIKERLEELADSMDEIGLINPIGLRPDGDRYEVKTGHRRYLAAQMKGWTKIKAEIKETSDEQTDWERLHENYYREDINPLEEAKYLQWLQDDKDLTQSKIADKIGKSRSYVTQRLNMLDWYDFLQQGVHNEAISFSIGRELNRLDDRKRAFTLYQSATQKNVSHKAIKKWVERSQRALQAKKEGEGNEGRNRMTEMEEKREQVRENAKDARQRQIEAQGRTTEKVRCEMCDEEYPRDRLHYIRICDGCSKVVDKAKKMRQDKVEQAVEDNEGD